MQGDLLITITGANVTKAAWVDRDLEELMDPLVPVA
jgi:hypothetical protein